jgi:hypothetical protein
MQVNIRGGDIYMNVLKVIDACQRGHGSPGLNVSCARIGHVGIPASYLNQLRGGAVEALKVAVQDRVEETSP